MVPAEQSAQPGQRRRFQYTIRGLLATVTVIGILLGAVMGVYRWQAVKAVDLSPHNWSAMERRGKILAVDDDALAMLGRFRQLRSLDLRDTQVTDGGLRQLTTLQRLEQLDIRGTQISDRGLQELRQALPRCKIAR